jgi:hypothetical protein
LPLRNVSEFAVPEPSLDGLMVPLISILAGSISLLASKDQLVMSLDDVFTVY